jgi:hypothetical protein
MAEPKHPALRCISPNTLAAKLGQNGNPDLMAVLDADFEK